MRQKILDSPMSELDVVMLEKELSKVILVSFCVCSYGGREKWGGVGPGTEMNS